MWDRKYYFEKVLPFGLRSAPYIFDKFTTALNWILANTCHLSDVIHYLDDFLDVSPPVDAIAHHHRPLILEMFAYLGVPVAPEKVEGPATSLTFLGLELDMHGASHGPPLSVQMPNLPHHCDCYFEVRQTFKARTRLCVGKPLLRFSGCPSWTNILAPPV